MYSVKTLFFWTLVLYIRAAKWFEYKLLRLLRAPINKFITRKAAAHGIFINDHPGDFGADTTSSNFIQLQVHNPDTFIRIINGGVVGLAESYMEKWWECDQLEDLSVKLAELFENVKPHPLLRLQDWITLNSDERPWEEVMGGWVTQMGTDFFDVMLGGHKLYMCGHWSNAATIEQAQTDNMNLLGKKLKLLPGMRLLDLGSGYGAMTRFLADRFNIEAVGCTISHEEAAKANEYKTTNVKIIECDYKNIPGKFDRIVCVQMLEHLGGPRHYKEFFEKVDSLLATDGLFVLQSTVITSTSPLRTDPFGRKYMLMNSVSPHTLEILNAAECKFLVEDVENIGANLEKTVLAYEANMERGWKEMLSKKYNIKYYRMFHLYLKVFLSAVKTRRVQMWQLVLSKKNSVSSYEPVREK